jgi:NDP-sugar pyrophosphorylase family protein
MKVIVPCCGSSSRFPGQPPKWMLPAHDGRPMLRLAIAGLEMSLDDLVVTILAEHEATYSVIAGLEKAFGRPIKVVALEERTKSQSETVACTLRKLGLEEPFFVKDSDGVFNLDGLEDRKSVV